MPTPWWTKAPRPGVSTRTQAGASGDEEVFEAYASYKDGRQKLKELQRSRGFLRPRAQDGGSGNMSEEKKQAIAREKARTRCAVCGRLGHWAGDSACQKGSAGGKKGAKKGRGNDRGHGKSKGTDKAYAVFHEPRFFSLENHEDDADGYWNMVAPGKDDEAKYKMEQDSGHTETDDRRKIRDSPGSSSSTWGEVCTPPFPASGRGGYGSLPADLPPVAFPEHKPKDDGQQLVVTVPRDNIEIKDVTSYLDVKPKSLEQLRLRELQADCV